MTKSLVHSLEGYIPAVFKDIAWTYGNTSDWERDRNRSLHELAIRGERFLTIDLPTIRKHFERCLEEGQYVVGDIYLGRLVSNKIKVPAFLRNLYLQVFHKDGKLRDDPSEHAIADIRQLCEGLGKLKNPCKPGVIDEEVKTFLKIEKETRRPSLNWTGDELYNSCTEVRKYSFRDLRLRKDTLQLSLTEQELSIHRSNLTLFEMDTLQAVCDIISTQFGDLHHEESTELPQHGNGRVSNLAKDQSKFSFGNWPAKLDHVFNYDRYAVANFSAAGYRDSSWSYLNKEEPSKLIAVPKTMSGPRLIASEPNYHQWTQQLVRNQLEARVKRTSLAFCISFGDQEPNRRLALAASSSRLQTTVDLKSASDRLSCWTVERVFRSNLSILDRLHATRTRMMTNRVTKTHFDTIVLKKCFTQGSACTFPVQTIVYSMMAIAATLITKGKRPTASNIARYAPLVRVFGDDIIVETTVLPKLQDILEANGLMVNLSKTFHKGAFRESCGLDAYQGVEVTPARIKRLSCNPSHEVAVSMLESSNNLFKRGMWHTASWLMSHLRGFDFTVSKIKDLQMRYFEDPGYQTHDFAGYSSFCGSKGSHLKKRWNPRLQREEVKSHVLISKSTVIPTQSAHDLTQFLFQSIRREAFGESRLSYLAPRPGNSIGVVDKSSSVLSYRWISLPITAH